MSSKMDLIVIGDEKWFKIENHDAIRPFLMSIVSDSNHWMFVASNGGISAGRKNSRFALFPYYTDDKLVDLAEVSGSKTIIKVHHQGKCILWEPFSRQCKSPYPTQKNIYKTVYGNKVMFEEIQHELGLCFRYQWNSSKKFGFIRKVELINTSDNEYRIEILDGIQNVMPYGVEPDTQNAVSNLVDAYKRTEILPESGLALFTLSAIIVDKTEPSEALKANIAWSHGVQDPIYLGSSLQLDRFRKDQAIQAESDIKGEKGAFFTVQDLRIKSGSTQGWSVIANVNQNHSQITEIIHRIANNPDMMAEVQDDIDRGTKALVQLVASADGLRLSSDPIKDARHFSNTLFNIMRGGVFDDNYTIEKQDLLRYLEKANQQVYHRNHQLLSTLPEQCDLQDLRRLIQGVDEPDLYRLCIEYLPLKFSRRHGDPSRPWNQFSINTQNELDGSKVLDYEGNWRDIFQNWEALVHSYPEFIEGMIFKFLNASTFDGYNPYRLTKDGFDWEVIEPENPWSYIGYWGDHQIIYLLKFLEFYQTYKPEAFKNIFQNACFVYANVPYKIKSFEAIVEDPKNTIDFDASLDHAIREAMAEYGSDATLLHSKQEGIHHVSFFEKILATLLAKISNFIPEAGIWLNTQRPEWNDANNALVGNGASMVTLYYLHRFLKFWERPLSASTVGGFEVSKELLACFQELQSVLRKYSSSLAGPIDDNLRKIIATELGQAGSDYRCGIYQNGFSGDKEELSLVQIQDFFQSCLKFVEHSIQANRRDDHLYHAYNLVEFKQDGVSILHLSEMLEGQVAVLSAHYLSTDQVLGLLDSLRQSDLYRADQNSYLLYPNKTLPRFLEKNHIPSEKVHALSLLSDMADHQDQRIVSRDLLGRYHFNGNFRNASDLLKALDQIQDDPYRTLIEQQRDAILQLFEEIFHHKAFTGRSGTFFAYEGLGSIYWHMVSKLHLAVQENYLTAQKAGEPLEVLEPLRAHYMHIGDGIGIHKSPQHYGAFSTDPYSHTPSHRGAQQPGMTGQVKEDLLVHMAETGLTVEDGIIRFKPSLLYKKDFLAESQSFHHIDLDQQEREIQIPPMSHVFSFCQIPIIYTLSDRAYIDLVYQQGHRVQLDGFVLGKDLSKDIFLRTSGINHIHIFLNEKDVL